MLRRRLSAASLLLLLVVAAPAAAFPASDALVDVRYAASSTPVVLAAGGVEVVGRAHEGLFVAGLNGTRLGPLVELEVAESDGTSVRPESYRDVFLVLHRGTLVWMLENGSALTIRAGAAYGLGVALPKAPFGGDEGAASAPGVLLTGPGISGTLRSEGQEALLLLGDATVSIQDAQGKPREDWDRRRVNENLSPSADGEPMTLFRALRPFNGTVAADGFATSVGAGADMTMSVRPSATDRLAETLDLFVRVGRELGGAGADGSAGGGALGGGPLETLKGFSGILNGAILVLGQPDADAPVPTTATIAGEEVDVGKFALMRSRDLALAWENSEMRIQGTSTVAATKSGFAVKAPQSIGVVPLVSAFLWVLAVGALVVFFVKRPPKGVHSLGLRAGSFALYLAAFALVFYLWDASFAETFGTSFLTRLSESGVSADTIGGLGTLLGIQMLPWSVAALFFALPVRIALGVGLRYLGRGKSYKGVANAGGLVSLAIFGPFYALWLLDVLIGGFVAGIPAFAGGP